MSHNVLKVLSASPGISWTHDDGNCPLKYNPQENKKKQEHEKNKQTKKQEDEEKNVKKENEKTARDVGWFFFF